jgi:hypothetical protein
VPTFPTLKTGVIAQYPSSRTRQFSTKVFRFVDGSEQRFSGYGAPIRRWTIPLELLDDSELDQLSKFFDEQAGRAGNFAFADPWDGTVYPSCSFDDDKLGLEFGDRLLGRTAVTVRENRS